MRLYIFLQCDTTSFLTFFFQIFQIVTGVNFIRSSNFISNYVCVIHYSDDVTRFSENDLRHPPKNDPLIIDMKKATLHIKRNSIWRLLLLDVEDETRDLNITISIFEMM